MQHLQRLASFHAGPLSWSNWNLECWRVFLFSFGVVSVLTAHNGLTSWFYLIEGGIRWFCWSCERLTAHNGLTSWFNLIEGGH